MNDSIEVSEASELIALWLKEKKEQPFNMDGWDFFVTSDGIIKEAANRSTVGVILPHPKPKKKQSHFIIFNADIENVEGAELSVGDSSAVGVSFICIARLCGLNEHKTSLVTSALIDGWIEVIDYTFDHVIKVTPAEQKALRAGKDVVKRGYTLTPTDESWHRSGNILLKYEGKTYLLGQDEGSYFGVEMPCSSKSVGDAFKDLMPSFVRGKKGVERQGEWYAVPVGKKYLPKFGTYFEIDEMVLPRESEDSNRHVLKNEHGHESCCIMITHPTDGQLSKIFTRDTTLRHDEHETLCFGPQWVQLVRNLAVRSVSVEGVD